MQTLTRMLSSSRKAGPQAKHACLAIGFSLLVPLTACAANSAQSQQSQPALPASSNTQTLSSLLRAQGYKAVSLNRLPSGLDIVTGSLNGGRISFLLDTGASNTVVDSARLGQWGLNANNSVFTETAFGAGGKVQLSTHAISGLAFNRKNYALPRVNATDLSALINALSQDFGVRIDGVLGQDFLIEHDAVIDVSQRTLFLR